jgi:hypothetical protein
VGAVLPPSSLLHLLPPLVPPPSSYPPCADVTSGARASASVALVGARNAKLASAGLASAVVAGTAHCGSKCMGCKGGCN